MLNFLKKQANLTYTENGGLTYSTTENNCLDLFFRAGGMRDAKEKEILDIVTSAYAESPRTTMKILFYIRDIRGGLSERRFFRIAMKILSVYAPDAVERNIQYISEYGRYDDLLVFLDTPCESCAVNEIKKQLESDIKSANNNESISLLAKWLPSVNASSDKTKVMGKKLARLLGMSDKEYRQTLSKLRKYIDIIENHIRTYDYTFDYSKQPSCAMFKYRNAFITYDKERYKQYLKEVQSGKEKINTSVLQPYEIVRRCFSLFKEDTDERLSLDVTWNNLPSYGDNNENAIAVIDTSGSMTIGQRNSIRPIDVSLSLGIYFAEHNKGEFSNHFITFSENPRLIEIKGNDIYEKARYCKKFKELANTNLEAVFKLILDTAVKNKLLQSDIPEKIYIISDMEFDSCIINGNSYPLFETMKKMYERKGYKLPCVVFWNVASRNNNIPVTMSETGVTLVSGFSPLVFDMTISGDMSPLDAMNNIILSERYLVIK